MDKKTAMTLDEIEALPREYLIPREAAAVLGATPYYINIVAKQHPERLGFPVIFFGCRAKIPKAAFLRYMRGEDKTCQ